MAAFAWSPQRENAALWWAQAQMSIDEIAAKVGVDRRTLFTWRQHPDFQARCNAERDAITAEIRRVGIADKNNRLANLNHLYKLHAKLVNDRADDKQLADAPGGTTGLVVIDVKRVSLDSDDPKGAKTTEVAEYPYDPAVSREMRELMKQMAIELGEWQATDDPSGLELRAAVAKTAERSEGYVDPDDNPADVTSLGCDTSDGDCPDE